MPDLPDLPDTPETPEAPALTPPPAAESRQDLLAPPQRALRVAGLQQLSSLGEVHG